MKIDVYDYRKMEEGRPLHTTTDCPEELEDRMAVWGRNGWVVGILPVDGDIPEGIAAVEFFNDLVLHRTIITDIQEGIRALYAIDPPILTAKQRSMIQGRGPAHEDTSVEM